MRIQTIAAALCRVCVVVACAFATWRSLALARADWAMGKGTLGNVDRAIRMEPDDGSLLTIAAEFRSNAGDMSPAVDRALERAARLNPLDSSIPMTLGIRAEFRGDLTEAERQLVLAAELDRQFKPAWTLANFYLRRNRPDKVWPLIHRCLNLEPLGFDPAPVFDLCWNLTGDSKKILAQIPGTGPRLVQYLNYLAGADLTQQAKVDAAIDVWPRALSLIDPNQPQEVAAAIPFPGFMVRAGRVPFAVQAWNSLIDRGIVHAGRLDPAHGVLIADPTFAYRRADTLFGWNLTNVGGIFFSGASPSLRIEFDGNEPEQTDIATTLAPVEPGRKYRLVWKADGSGLATPADTGLHFRLLPLTGTTFVACGPLLSDGGAGACDFTASADQQIARVQFVYVRAPGTVRIHGFVKLERVALEPAP